MTKSEKVPIFGIFSPKTILMFRVGLKNRVGRPTGTTHTCLIIISTLIASRLSVASPTADPGVVSLIPARSHTLVEIDGEIISMHGLSPPSTDSRRVVVSYKQKYVHEVLVNHFSSQASSGKKCG